MEVFSLTTAGLRYAVGWVSREITISIDNSEIIVATGFARNSGYV